MRIRLVQQILASVIFFVSCLSASDAILDVLVPVELTGEHSGIKDIDCIYVINLKERPAKWETLKNALECQGIRPNRVNAINGWQLPKSVIKRIGSSGRKVRLGQLGCFLSHLSIWKDAIERDWDVIWVMEDDVVFFQPVSEVQAILNELKSIDPDWDLLYTDPDYRCPHSGESIATPPFYLNHPSVLIKDLNYYHVKESVSDNLTRIYGRWGTYSVVISKSGIRKLFNSVVSNHIFSNIDHQIHTSVPSLRQYAPRTVIVTHEVTGISDTSLAPQ